MLQSKVIVHKLTTSYYYYLPCITFFLECIYFTIYHTLSGRPEVTLVIISEKKKKVLVLSPDILKRLMTEGMIRELTIEYSMPQI